MENTTWLYQIRKVRNQVSKSIVNNRLYIANVIQSRSSSIGKRKIPMITDKHKLVKAILQTTQRFCSEEPQVMKIHRYPIYQSWIFVNANKTIRENSSIGHSQTLYTPRWSCACITPSVLVVSSSLTLVLKAFPIRKVRAFSVSPYEIIRIELSAIFGKWLCKHHPSNSNPNAFPSDRLFENNKKKGEPLQLHSTPVTSRWETCSALTTARSPSSTFISSATTRQGWIVGGGCSRRDWGELVVRVCV